MKKTSIKNVILSLTILSTILFTLNTNETEAKNGYTNNSPNPKQNCQQSSTCTNTNPGPKNLSGTYISQKRSVNNLPKQDISDIEKTNLINMYYEEQTANTFYQKLSEMYPTIRSFAKIKNAENKHQLSIRSLLNKYNITVENKDITTTDLYKDLINKSQTVKDALITAINLEIQDINDLINLAKNTDNDDIKLIAINLGNASINHIKGLYKDLKTIDSSANIDVSKYIDVNNLYNNKKDKTTNKMIDLLKENNVSIPNIAIPQKNVMNKKMNNQKNSNNNR